MATVRCFGEGAVGNWTLSVRDLRPANTHQTAVVKQWSVFVYGHGLPASPPPAPAAPSFATVAVVTAASLTGLVLLAFVGALLWCPPRSPALPNRATDCFWLLLVASDCF